MYVFIYFFKNKRLQRTLFKTELQAVQENELNNQDVEPVIRKSKYEYIHFKSYSINNIKHKIH